MTIIAESRKTVELTSPEEPFLDHCSSFLVSVILGLWVLGAGLDTNVSGSLTTFKRIFFFWLMCPSSDHFLKFENTQITMGYVSQHVAV